jgi:Rrf2 family iron-sulfur cluster assembly transcriptional regulator
MRLSSQEEYGLRCLLRLARKEAREPVSIQEIADAEGMTPEYVAKLMRVLREGGLVHSTRGAGGGYRLVRPAADVTIWQALEVLTTDCSIRALWRGINSMLRSALSGITLADLMRGSETLFAWLARANLEDSAAGTAMDYQRFGEVLTRAGARE